MDSFLRSFSQLVSTGLLLVVVLVAVAAGIVFLLVFLTAQRGWQHLRTRRFDALSFKLHAQWREIVRGDMPAKEWQNSSLRCEIVQSILIQEINAATEKDRPRLQEFLRASGLLNRCIAQVRRRKGWSRRRAMLALGAMRVPEEIIPLARSLDD